MTLGDRRLALLGSLLLASAFCAALVIGRIVHTGVPNFVYLIWNLFLAWIPFAIAIAVVVYDRYRHGARPALLVGLGVLWLLFFPNAPYILTDFVHLNRDPLSPLWYDAITITSFAFMGLLLGFASLYLMQSVVRRAVGARAGWSLVAAAIVLGSLGIYIGRFVRLNSWDTFSHPRLLLAIARVRVHEPLGNPKLIAVTLLFTGFLGVAYLVLYNMASLRLELDR